MQSERDNIQSGFAICHPFLTTVTKHSGRPGPSAKKHIQKKHILLIDPDADNLKLHTDCLRYAQHEVSSVQTGFEALEILLPEIRTFPQLRNRILKLCGTHATPFSKQSANNPQTTHLFPQNSQAAIMSPSAPDLIVLDLRLTDVSGLWLTRFLKENPSTSSIPILIFTALTLKHHETQAFEAGCNRFLGKPSSMKTFLSTINTIFGNTVFGDHNLEEHATKRIIPYAHTTHR